MRKPKQEANEKVGIEKMEKKKKTKTKIKAKDGIKNGEIKLKTKGISNDSSNKTPLVSPRVTSKKKVK